MALRHLIGGPVVQVIQAGEALPFDVAGLRTVPIHDHDDSAISESIEAIVRQIDARVESGTHAETSISVAFDVPRLRASDDAEDRALAAILGVLSRARPGYEDWATLRARDDAPDPLVEMFDERLMARIIDAEHLMGYEDYRAWRDRRRRR